MAMILLPMLLTACGGERVVVVKPPVELTQTVAVPQAPVLPAVDWADPIAAKEVARTRDLLTLDYVLDLVRAVGLANAKIEGVRAWSDGLE